MSPGPSSFRGGRGDEGRGSGGRGRSGARCLSRTLSPSSMYARGGGGGGRTVNVRTATTIRAVVYSGDNHGDSAVGGSGARISRGVGVSRAMSPTASSSARVVKRKPRNNRRNSR